MLLKAWRQQENWRYWLKKHFASHDIYLHNFFCLAVASGEIFTPQNTTKPCPRETKVAEYSPQEQWQLLSNYLPEKQNCLPGFNAIQLSIVEVYLEEKPHWSWKRKTSENGKLVKSHQLDLAEAVYRNRAKMQMSICLPDLYFHGIKAKQGRRANQRASILGYILPQALCL